MRTRLDLGNRRIYWVASLTLLGILLTTCGDSTITLSPTTQTANTTAKTAGAVNSKSKVILTQILSNGWNKTPDAELARRFEAESGIHVEFQLLDFDTYPDLLRTRLLAQTDLDIFELQSVVNELQPVYDVQKNAVDLSSEEWIKREDPLSVAQTTLNGKVYGLTIYDIIGTTWVVYYNKAIFQKLGLSVPKTYAEFKALCLKIQSANLIPLFEPGAAGWHTALWLGEIGGRYEELNPGLANKLNANQATFAGNSGMLTALQQLKEMYSLGFFGPTTTADPFEDIWKNLASGKYAMTLYVIGAANEFQKRFPDAPDAKVDNWGYFVMPLADNQVLNVNPGGPSKFIYSGSKHIEEAKAYFRFLTRPDNLQYLLDNETSFSGLNFSGLKDKFTPEQKAFFATYPKKGPVYQVAVNYLSAQWTDINKDLTKMFIGSLKPEEVLKRIDERRTTLAKAAKDPAWK
jgi:raffinose/stachyose/melibiose transport system substrate-binding protein